MLSFVQLFGIAIGLVLVNLIFGLVVKFGEDENLISKTQEKVVFSFLFLFSLIIFIYTIIYNLGFGLAYMFILLAGLDVFLMIKGVRRV